MADSFKIPGGDWILPDDTDIDPAVVVVEWLSVGVSRPPSPPHPSPPPLDGSGARAKLGVRLQLNKIHLDALRRKTVTTAFAAPPGPSAPAPEGSGAAPLPDTGGADGAGGAGGVRGADSADDVRGAEGVGDSAKARPARAASFKARGGRASAAADEETESDWCGEVERALGYQFLNRALLRQALTHSSHQHTPQTHNERMEFFGDAVLDLVVRERLFHQFPERREGELTEIKSATVHGKALCLAARRMGLERFLKIGRSVRKRNKDIPDSMLGDAYEALVAAIYLDGGYEAARRFIVRTLASDLVTRAREAAQANPKSMLQQYLQQRMQTVPVYKMVGHDGPGHARVFTMSVSAGNRVLGQGSGSNKKEAEQAAARAALAALEPPKA